jgi:hypothetical protein
MFDGSLPEIAELAALDDAALVDAARGWFRSENAACARKLAVMAELFRRRTGCETAEERDGWWVDPERAVAAELAAAQGISQGLALAQTHRGVALMDRLPKVAELFAAGEISDLLVRAIAYRTALITDPELMAQLDAAVAAEVTKWGPLSVAKTEQAIDALVDRIDPGALRRTRSVIRQRYIDFGSPGDEAGFTSLWGRLYAPDAAVLERRLDELAASVCDEDPRTVDERRADAMAALATGSDRLACACGSDECPAGPSDKPARDVVIHVVADATAVDAAASPSDPTPTEPPAPTEDETVAPSDETAEPAPPSVRAQAKPSPVPPLVIDSTGAAVDPVCPPPAFVMGGDVMPAPLLAGLMERATIREIRHPGDAPPEPRYCPSRALADFVRCRDLTCRWPGCDKPADICDIDHTVPYPVGPTHASNLKCQCRFHHLLKTFWTGEHGWRDRQLPDGTVIWTSPTGHTYITRPGSALLFPALCKPTGRLLLPEFVTVVTGDRGLMMPKRRRCRAQDRAYRIDAERRLNDDLVAERNKPPPF